MVVSLKKSSVQKRIIASAMLMFQSKGYAGASMQEIADKAEINKAMLHYYFRSKENLYNVAVTESIKIFTNAIEYSKLEELNLFELILDYLQILEGIFKQHPHLAGFLIELSNSKSSQIKYSGFIDAGLAGIFESKIQDAKSAGLINDVSARALIINILSLSIFPYLIKKPLSKLNQKAQDEAIGYQQIYQTPVAMCEFIFTSISQ